MRENILKFVICPVCKESNFSLEKEVRDNFEIREGYIVCLKCREKYLINKGILYLYKKISGEAETEKMALQEEMASQKNMLSYRNEEWLLNYPDNKKLGTDDRTEKTIRLISENSLSSLKHYIPSNNLNILELGAASCWMTARLAENNNCIALDTLTMPPYGLESADVFIKNKSVFFERISADMIELPFKNGSFDIVLISSSLHHSSNVDQSLKEIYRTLKPNGQLVIFNEPSHGFITTTERKRLVEDIKQGLNEKRYKIKDWKNFFKKAGFRYKIHLPMNFIDVLNSRGKCYKFIGYLLLKLPDSIKKPLMSFMGIFIFKLFDGFFNAVVYKK